jgi:hypothetical protein
MARPHIAPSDPFTGPSEALGIRTFGYIGPQWKVRVELRSAAICAPA